MPVMNLNLTSTEFLFLLPIAVLIYYLIPNRLRQYYLLFINLLFYASFGYRYIPVIVIEALIAWVSTTRPRFKGGKTFLLLSITVLVVILIFFKLGDHITESIVAPLGISFYTLQAISYIVDVYREEVVPEKNLIRLITYLSFFPTITSGPIYRYKDFSNEYNRNNEELRPEYDRIVNGIIYMIYGYFLKLVISSRAAIAVDTVFADHRTENYGWVVLAIVASLYSIQIFTDFAGYSAIVIGIAQILGYRVPENFLAPYMSMSIKEFWGRWHISLSSWLKDYIYIPLGGNRNGKFRKYLNIMITFIISGLWHGVNGVHYIVWGLIHGIYQVVGDITGNFVEKNVENIGIKRNSSFHHMLKRAFTFFFVTIAWIFFRTGTKDALMYIKEMFTTPGIVKAVNGELLAIGLSTGDWVLLAASFLFVYVVDKTQYNRDVRLDALVESQGTIGKCVVTIILSLTILIFGIYGDCHDASYFIYKNF